MKLLGLAFVVHVFVLPQFGGAPKDLCFVEDTTLALLVVVAGTTPGRPEMFVRHNDGIVVGGNPVPVR
ncbi:MAG: hypothetical protein ACI867_001071 [Glaciecola sp.]|jgi:hypothetical protein